MKDRLNNYGMVTSVAVATLLSLGLVSTQSNNVKADVNSSQEILVKNKKSSSNSLENSNVQSANSSASTNQQNVNSKNPDNNTNNKSLSGQNDPIYHGSDVSNGYTDQGYTYVKPTLTSPEREESYHLTTNEGWSNDLQTIMYDSANKEYDIYYLHTIGGAGSNTGAVQNWNRVTTKDFIHFSQPNNAIVAKGTIPNAWGSAWTGSIITNEGNMPDVPKGDKVAYFSGLSNKDNQQNIWAAWSDNNGITFNHPLWGQFPVIDHYWNFTAKDKTNERDAAVFYWKGKMIMYAAEGWDLGVYKSTDGVRWSKANPNNESKVYNDQYFRGLKFESPVECPAVRSMREPNGTVKQVLFYGCKSPQDGQTTGTYYIVGKLESNGIFTPEGTAKRLDQGSDYYGANFSEQNDLDIPVDSLITMGWIGNWNYVNSGVRTSQNNYPETSQRIGAYSLARRITLDNNGNIISTPIDAALKPRKIQNISKVVNNSANETSDSFYSVVTLEKQPVNSKYTLNFSTVNGNFYNGTIQIKFTQGKDNNTITYNPVSGEYRINGFSSELTGDAANYYDKGLAGGTGYINNSGLKGQKSFTLTIYTDKDSIELSFPNGTVYTMARFCVNNVQDISISSQDPDKDEKINISEGEVGPDLIGYEAKTPTTPTAPIQPTAPVQPTQPSNVSPHAKGTTVRLWENKYAVIYDANHHQVAGASMYKIGSGHNLVADKNGLPRVYHLNGFAAFKLADGSQKDDYLDIRNFKNYGLIKTLKINSRIYTFKGKVARPVKYLGKGSKIKIYGEFKIKDRLFYRVGRNQFILVRNFSVGKTRRATKVVKRLSRIYKSSGRVAHPTKFIRKGSRITVYGKTRIHGKRFYRLSGGRFVLVNNIR